MSDLRNDGDLITIIDDDGQEFELEYIDEIDYNGSTFIAFLPANMDESDPDYGLIILRSMLDENGEELFESIDDEAELDDVFNKFMVLLFDDEEEPSEDTEEEGEA
ncbi:MAG: DUF1292 domain-containing protein [Oscillospiraceae bacterium]|nr:DUF1292 domain-containing protein [Oscillospiraceae bacterium]